MKIVPRSHIKVDYDFPKAPAREQIESALYYAEGWTPHLDEEKEVTVLTFDDIREYFDGWDQFSDYCEIYFNGIDSEECRKAYSEECYKTVYDYIESCLLWYGGAFWPVAIDNKEEV